MPHRRPSSPRRRVTVARPAAAGVRFAVESLESRRLLTTFSGSGTQLFADLNDQPILITYSNVTFEAVFDQAGAASNYIPYPLPPGESVGANLFKLYITDATYDSSISVSLINPTTGAYLPYSGAVGYGSVDTDGAAPYPVNLPFGTVALGASGTETSIPLLNSFGLQPAPESGALTGGIEMTNLSPTTGLQNNLGSLLVGGTVFGSVYLGGNVDQFYAGAVLTGQLALGPAGLVQLTGTPTTAPLAAAQPTLAPGQTAPTATPASLANFTVTGDLRSFQTLGTVGTDGAGTAAQPLYVTDFAMTVGGQLGQMRVGNSFRAGLGAFAGTVQVYHNGDIAEAVAPTTPYTADVAAAVGTAVYNPGNTAPQMETEYLTASTLGPGQGFGQLSDQGILTDDLRNDTATPVILSDGARVDLPTDPQILVGTPELSETSGLPIHDTSGNLVYQANLDGELQGTVQGNAADTTDDYAMAFLAGQTFTATVTAGLTLDIMDPDGRVVASNVEAGGGPIQVVTDRPGLYYFEVSEATPADTLYVLSVTGTGDLGAGGITANGAFFTDDGFDQGLVVHAGDLGCVLAGNQSAVQVGGVYFSGTLGPTAANNSALPLKAATSIGVNAGSLRAVYAAALGVRTAANPAILSNGPTLNVPFGNVGLIRTADVLNLETQFDLNTATNTGTTAKVTDTANATAIGGSVQVIDAGGTFQTDLAVDGGVGTIHAGDMATGQASYFDVNADNKGNDGIIDLIDCRGDFGTFAAGGPAFITNDGGMIRYVTVTGTVYRDLLFGNPDDPVVTAAPGTPMAFTDQAGNRVTLTPEGPITYASAVGTGATTITGGPTVSAELYPVRDKSGEIPISVTSTQGLVISAAGTAGNNAELDIGQVTVEGTGRAVVATGATDQFGNPTIAQESATGTLTGVQTTGTAGTGATPGGVTGTLVPTGGGAIDPTDTFLLLQGPATVNVLDVTSTVDAVAVQNATRGEIVSLTSPDIGTIQTVGNLGFATPEATPAAVMPRPIIANGNAYPFVQQHTGVVIGSGIPFNAAVPGSLPGTGSAVAVLVGGAVANVQVGSVLQTLVANFGGHAPPGQVDGINGPILAGILSNVNIGQGIAFNGTGLVGQAGLFAPGDVGVVTNGGNPGANIRGVIIGGEDTVVVPGLTVATTYTPVTAVGNVTLVNGSLIDARILDLAGPYFLEASDLSPVALTVAGNVQVPTAVPYNYDIGTVSVSGAGGIIGTEIAATDIGAVIVANGGFGILTSDVGSVGLGRVGEVVASGYGIRATSIGGGGYIGPVTASGNGSNLPVTNFPTAVRAGDVYNVTPDPAFGFLPYNKTDLDAALGIVGSAGSVSDATDTGVVEDDTINCLQDFAGLTAHAARAAVGAVTTNANTTTSALNIPVVGLQFSNNVDVGGVLGLLRIYGTVDGLQVVAGQVRKVLISNDVSRLGIASAGQINSLVVHGNLGQTLTDPLTGDQVPDSYVEATGPAGTITNMQVYGSLFANVVATGRINTLVVRGDIAGSITAQGNVTGTNAANANGAAYSVNTLQVGGGIRDGSLSLTGRVNNLIINNGLGATGGTLVIDGGANNIRVGASRHAGAKLALGLTVDGSLNNLNVFGEITGSVTVLGDLDHLTVTNDGSTANAISGPITVGGRLVNATVTGGNVDADVTVTGDIDSFTVNRGSIAAGATVASTLASVRSLRVVGGGQYGIDGSVSAPSGTDLNLYTTGNVGDGVTPNTITALSATAIRIGGAVNGTSSLTFAGPLNSLTVGGNVNAGATIVGTPIRHKRIGGTTNGTVSG